MNPMALTLVPAAFHAAAAHPIAAILAVLASFGLIGMAASVPFPLIPSTSPDYDTIEGQAANLPFQYQVVVGNADALTGGGGGLNALAALAKAGATPPICGTVFIETAGVDAATLATPVAGSPASGGNDGLSLTVFDNGGHAHTITTAANVINGNKHIATFNATRSSFITFVARNGVWLVEASNGVALT